MKGIIYADGGSRGNPGTAGSGTVIYAADGKTILDEIVYV
ncbi:MAG: bifunctional RNase H/acid phosphatase, partial [Corynebacterium casei]|nr:bifunctional RNase H/acid phosphatase [Corynebacterium casei]